MKNQKSNNYLYHIWKIGFCSDEPLELPTGKGESEYDQLIQLITVPFEQYVMIPDEKIVFQKSFEENTICVLMTYDSKLIFSGILTSKIKSVIIKHTIIPFLLARKYNTIFVHGSSCAINNLACAFLGNKYSGKSTIVGYLSHFGATTLADDMVPLQINSLLEGKTIKIDTTNKLRHNTKKFFDQFFYNKYPLSADYYSDDLLEYQLKNIFFLNPTNKELKIEGLSQAKGKLKFISHIYDTLLMDENKYHILMKWKEVNFYNVHYPHNFDVLDQTAKQIYSIVKS